MLPGIHKTYGDIFKSKIKRNGGCWKTQDMFLILISTQHSCSFLMRVDKLADRWKVLTDA